MYTVYSRSTCIQGIKLHVFVLLTLNLYVDIGYSSYENTFCGIISCIVAVRHNRESIVLNFMFGEQ